MCVCELMYEEKCGQLFIAIVLCDSVMQKLLEMHLAAFMCCGRRTCCPWLSDGELTADQICGEK